jgi:putative FmdB family regulatory protein
MPTYQYRCTSCGHEHEVFQRMSDAPITTCPQCAKDDCVRVISAEGGFVLKGSGFYGTDYCGNKSKGSEAGSGCASGKCPHAG